MTRLPSIRAHLQLGTGLLGLALVGAPIGYALAVVLTPRAIRRWSSYAVTRAAVTLAMLTNILPAIATDFATLVAGFVILGSVFAVAEIAINVQAVAVERGVDRPLMSGLHARWSIGLILGSLGSAVAAAAGVGPATQLVVVGVVLCVAAALNSRGLLSADYERRLPVPASEPRAGGGRHWSPVVALLGTIAFCSYLTEGSVSDWSGIYLHGSQNASLGVAALAVFVYSAGATGARLAGNSVVATLGRTPTLWRAAGLASVGMIIAVVAPGPAIALVGYAILGVGVAVIVPVCFSIGGMTSGVAPESTMARVSGMGYGGSFVGPVVIGLVASVTGLGAALVIPAAMLLLIIPLTLRLRKALSPSELELVDQRR